MGTTNVLTSRCDFLSNQHTPSSIGCKLLHCATSRAIPESGSKNHKKRKCAPNLVPGLWRGNHMWLLANKSRPTRFATREVHGRATVPPYHASPMFGPLRIKICYTRGPIFPDTTGVQSLQVGFAETPTKSNAPFSCYHFACRPLAPGERWAIGLFVY